REEVQSGGVKGGGVGGETSLAKSSILRARPSMGTGGDWSWSVVGSGCRFVAEAFTGLVQSRVVGLARSMEGDRAGASLWHVRPELAAMDQGLQRFGDLTLVLVERVEHLAQLVAPAVDLVGEVRARAGECGPRQDLLHLFVHGELLLAFGPSVTTLAAHSTTHGAAGRARRTPRGAARAGPPGRVARSPASWRRTGQTPGGGRVLARGGASGRGSDGTRGRPLCRSPGGRTGHRKGSSGRSRSRRGRA